MRGSVSRGACWHSLGDGGGIRGGRAQVAAEVGVRAPFAGWRGPGAGGGCKGLADDPLERMDARAGACADECAVEGGWA